MFDRPIKQGDPFTRQGPETLYHYSGWQAATRIIESQRFWATAHDCTNDPHELKSADHIVLDVVAELQRTVTGNAARVLQLFREQFENRHATRMIPVYLACFSGANDSLSQWQAYGDLGRGLCLGVGIDSERAINPGLGCKLVPVEYSEESLRASAQQSFSLFVAAINTQQTAGDAYIELGAWAFANVAAGLAISAKEPRFATEDEYRFVAMAHRNDPIEPCTRVGESGQTIRYVPLRIRREGRRMRIHEIVIGPKHDSRLQRRELGQLLIRCGYRAGQPNYPTIRESSCLTMS